MLASIYAADLSDAVASLSPANAEKAQGSIQGGLEVANSLSNTADANLTSSVHDAFNRGAVAGYIVLAVLAALATAWAWFALRRVAAEGGVTARSDSSGQTTAV